MLSETNSPQTEQTVSTDIFTDDTQIPVQGLFRNKRYLLLMAAQAVSNLGDWLYILALFVLVGFRWHATPMLISAMMLSLTGPMVILGPFTGALADKWNRTTLMLISNFVMAGLVATIPLLPAKWMLFAVLILIGMFESLFSPAESGKLKEIVPDEHMQKATSINSSITQFAKVIGPGLSGVIVAALGSMSAFWLDSISFVVSSGLLVFTGFRAAQSKDERDDESRSEQKNRTGKQRFMEGLNHIRRVRILFAGTIILTISLLAIQLTDAQIVTLIRLVPTASSGLLGLIMGLSGAGGVIGALLINLIKWTSTTRVMAVGTAGCGVGLGASALLVLQAHSVGHISPWWMTTVMAAALLVGFCASLIFIPFQTTAQRNTPSHLTGRVFGAIGSLTTAAALLGPALGGVVVTGLGVINAFIITSTALVIIGGTILVSRRWLEKDTGAIMTQDSVQM